MVSAKPPRSSILRETKTIPGEEAILPSVDVLPGTMSTGSLASQVNEGKNVPRLVGSNGRKDIVKMRDFESQDDRQYDIQKSGSWNKSMCVWHFDIKGFVAPSVWY